MKKVTREIADSIEIGGSVSGDGWGRNGTLIKVTKNGWIHRSFYSDWSLGHRWAPDFSTEDVVNDWEGYYVR